MPRVITGTGSYLPEQVVSNDALLEFVENFDERRAGCTLDEWYQRRYGVKERHWSAPWESTGDLAVHACRRAIEDAGIRADEIDLIVMSTATSDHIAPHSVSKVQAELGITAVFHQLQDACPGFLNAVMVADSLMENLGYQKALVVAAEEMTHIINKRDFRMAGLFADGAGAIVLEELPVDERFGFEAFYAGSNGAAGKALRVPAGGTAMPLTLERIATGQHYLISDFRDVYPFAVETTCKCITKLVDKAGLTIDDVQYVIPHHASANIIEDGIGQAGIHPSQVLMAIDHTGNTSSASVPTALDEFARKGQFEEDDRVLLLALGGGMAWGSTIFRWCSKATIAKARERA